MGQAGTEHHSPILGLIIVCVIIFLIVYYIFRRLIHGTKFSRSFKITALFIPLVTMISYFFMFYLFRYSPKWYPFLDVLMMINGGLWAFAIILFFLLIFHDLMLTLFLMGRGILIPGTDRSPFRLKLSAEQKTVRSIVLTGAAFVFFLIGFYQALYQPPLVEREISLGSNSKRYVKIAHLTDLHMGMYTGKKWFEKMIENVNQAGPDLIMITGDFADSRSDQREELSGMLRQFKAPVCFISGNHEIMWDYNEWMQSFSRNGAFVLDGKRKIFFLRGIKVLVAGVKDPGRNPWRFMVNKKFRTLLKGAPESDIRILLSHRPEILPEASKQGYDLVLAGHTHGGQTLPFKWFARLLTPYPKGFYKVRKTVLFVSPGAGFVGVPLRLGVPKEITLFTIKL
ncbi:MAG: metallophosphoesterase [Spirochaetes bacterium]|nr:metallophosphoesterase [Spirochaetota bacterium]